MKNTKILLLLMGYATIGFLSAEGITPVSLTRTEIIVLTGRPEVIYFLIDLNNFTKEENPSSDQINEIINKCEGRCSSKFKAFLKTLLGTVTSSEQLSTKDKTEIDNKDITTGE